MSSMVEYAIHASSYAICVSSSWIAVRVSAEQDQLSQPVAYLSSLPNLIPDLSKWENRRRVRSNVSFCSTAILSITTLKNFNSISIQFLLYPHNNSSLNPVPVPLLVRHETRVLGAVLTILLFAFGVDTSYTPTPVRTAHTSHPPLLPSVPVRCNFLF